MPVPICGTESVLVHHATKDTGTSVTHASPLKAALPPKATQFEGTWGHCPHSTKHLGLASLRSVPPSPSPDPDQGSETCLGHKPCSKIALNHFLKKLTSFSRVCGKVQSKNSRKLEVVKGTQEVDANGEK